VFLKILSLYGRTSAKRIAATALALTLHGIYVALVAPIDTRRQSVDIEVKLFPLLFASILTLVLSVFFGVKTHENLHKFTNGKVRELIVRTLEQIRAARKQFLIVIFKKICDLGKRVLRIAIFVVVVIVFTML
jgi:hypothetical protein